MELSNKEAYGLALLMLWLGINIGLNLLSKWEYTPKEDGGAGLSFPWLQALSDQIVALITLGAVFKARPELNTISNEQFQAFKLRLALFASLTILCIVSNNGSLITIGLSVNQIIKCCAPFAVTGLSFLIEKKRFSTQHVASVFLLVASAALSVPPTSWQMSPIGLTLATTAMLLGSTRNVVAAYLMKDAEQDGLTPVVLVFYVAAFSVPFCLMFWLSLELHDSVAYFKANALEAVCVMLGVSFASCFYNFLSFSATKATSALTFSIAGNVKQVLLIMVSMIFVDHNHFVQSWIGTAVFIGALLWYSKLSYEAKHKRPAAVSAQDKQADPAPTEATPLSGSENSSRGAPSSWWTSGGAGPVVSASSKTG